MTANLPTGIVTQLDPARVKPFKDQPRKRFRGIRQLAESIRAVGQITPIIVTPTSENGYDAELVDGERRLRACLLGRMPVRAVVEPDGEGDRFERSVAGNFCRQGHDAVEIMQAVLALLEAGRTVPQIAAIFGKTESWVYQYVSLRRLARPVLNRLKIAGDEAKLTKKQLRRRGRMTLAVALLLVPLDKRLQVKAMRGVAAGRMGTAEARTYVHKLGAAKGKSLGTRMTNPQRFRAIMAAVDNCWHVVERYLTMPGVQIRLLIRGASPAERRRVVRRLDELRESLQLLADEIRPRGDCR